jgi:predicted phosphodiesterase
MSALVLDGRVGLIGDVHAEDRLLELALTRLRDSGAETILCVGDLTDGPGSIDRVCALLAEHQVITVSGNHDRWVLGDTMRDLPYAIGRSEYSASALAFLRSLDRTHELSSSRGRVCLCHGLGTNDMAGVMPDDYGYGLEFNTELQALIADPDLAIVLNGHTHKPMVRHFPGLTIVNAGTIFHEHEPGYVVVDFDRGGVTWCSLESEAIQRTLGSLDDQKDL